MLFTLGAHPRSLDVIGKDVLHIKGDENVRNPEWGNPEWGGVVYPVVRTARVTSEVGRSPQQKRSQPTPVHQLPEPLLSLDLRLVEL